ncbi:histidine phosphatase family protein [Pseudonocardia bannensis]|uniref:Histidine phosphatase family protein n=1 Tax=Pseudonocardia bannensis TaxID=630973 RepID=A0A848DBY3_9PSEU|nr:histidine phosphatase family protein [Pseudonocardia bannensis]NMH90208.1 histidine phosphatase family protein [Pseudonocardia bannensis]
MGSGQGAGQPGHGEYDVVLLRHGETVGYDADHGLTPLGEEQARARGTALAAELKPGTTVRMPHARTARGTATAVTVRATLVEALGGEAVEGIEIGPLYPEPWFDNLRFNLHGEAVDTSVAVTTRLGLPDGELPDWAAEYDRFDTDYRAFAGGPIEYWLHNPTLYFEPPHVAAHRFWRGIATLGADRPDNLVAVVCTHSAPMRAFIATAIGSDPGEPENLEEIRVRVRPDDSATVTYRDHVVHMHVPPQPPPWIDRAWFESFGR